METFSLTSQNSTQKEFASRTWREPFLYVSVCVCECECVCDCVCVTRYANIIPIHVLQLCIVYYVYNIFIYLDVYSPISRVDEMRGGEGHVLGTGGGRRRDKCFSSFNVRNRRNLRKESWTYSKKIQKWTRDTRLRMRQRSQAKCSCRYTPTHLPHSLSLCLLKRKLNNCQFQNDLAMMYWFCYMNTLCIERQNFRLLTG